MTTQPGFNQADNPIPPTSQSNPNSLQPGAVNQPNYLGPQPKHKGSSDNKKNL